MKEKNYMTISEFAHITGIKRANLIFYDNAGLLTPEFRGANEYRYYSRRQLGSAYLITALRELGLGLKEIREYADQRTPENMLLLLEEQEKRIQKEINRLHRMKDMMKLHREMAKEGLRWNSDEILLREQGSEPIYLGKVSEPGQTDEEASIAFYETASKQGIEMGYPMGCVISKHMLESYQRGSQNILPVYQYYFKVKHDSNAYKPKGLYAAASGICGYGGSQFIYDRLLAFLKTRGLRICGNAYEEYLMNEMAIKDDSQYFVKIEVMVEYQCAQFYNNEDK